MTLFPWQVPQRDTIVRFLRDGGFFCDASTTGAGKTYTALSAASALRCPVLVVAPKAARTQWERVAADVGVRLVGIVNPQALIMSKRQPWYDAGTRLWTVPPDTLVIFDEVHRGASGIDSQTTFAVARLKAYRGVRLLCLSATVADSPLKMRATGYWLDFHRFNEPSFYAWCAANGCEYKQVPGSDRKLVKGVGRVECPPKYDYFFTGGPAAMRRIREAAGGRIAGLQVDDIPGFPEQRVEIVLVDLASKDRSEVERAYAEMSERMLSHPTDGRAAYAKELERVEFVMAEYRAEMAAKDVEDGNSVVLFFNFTEPRLRAEAWFRKRNLAFAAVHGDQRPDDRQEGIDAFQANAVHLATVMVQAGGVALSLHDVRHERLRISSLAPAANAAEFVQAMGRIRRTGGTHVLQKVVLAAQTPQERLAENLSKKIDNIDAINDSDLNPFKEQR